MDIQQYIAADKELLLNLNGSQSLFWDGFMWVATSTIVWVPVAAMLLYIIIKNNKIYSKNGYNTKVYYGSIENLGTLTINLSLIHI